jgi:hypothetical protein
MLQLSKSPFFVSEKYPQKNEQQNTTPLIHMNLSISTRNYCVYIKGTPQMCFDMMGQEILFQDKFSI